MLSSLACKRRMLTFGTMVCVGRWPRFWSLGQDSFKKLDLPHYLEARTVAGTRLCRAEDIYTCACADTSFHDTKPPRHINLRHDTVQLSLRMPISMTLSPPFTGGTPRKARSTPRPTLASQTWSIWSSTRNLKHKGIFEASLEASWRRL